MARHDADLGLPGRDDAGAVRPDEPAAGAEDEVLGTHHVGDRDALGDADHERDPGRCRFHDGVGGAGRRHEDQRAVGGLLPHGLLDGVPHREALVGGAALPRRHPADDIGAVFLAAGGVEGALLAGDALDDHPRGLVGQDAHRIAGSLPFAASSLQFARSFSASARETTVSRGRSTQKPTAMPALT